MRIAVLDNDRSQADLICQVLTSAGHICHSFQTGKDVLAQLRKDSYDMLILDWQVVDLTGNPYMFAGGVFLQAPAQISARP